MKNRLPYPSLDRLQALVDDTTQPRVSIYMPVETAFPARHQNPLRFRQLVEQAAERLKAGGYAADRAALALRHLGEASDAVIHGAETPLQAVAVFACPERATAFGLLRAVNERLGVGDHFDLRPVLEAARSDRTYHVLLLSHRRVALLEGGSQGLVQEPVRDLPKNLEEALGEELTPRGVMQHHGALMGDHAGNYHGQGGGKDEREVDRTRFHRVIARVLRSHIGDGRDPLVLAADRAHQGPFRKVASLPGLLEQGVEENCDHLDAGAIHERAWPLVQEALRRSIADASASFGKAQKTGRGVDELSGVVDAVVTGRAHRLWIARDARKPGRIDGGSGSLVGANGNDDDVFDQLAEVMLRYRKDVLVVPPDRMPVPGPVAAELH